MNLVSITLLTLFSLAYSEVTTGVVTENQAKKYLEKYGYLNNKRKSLIQSLKLTLGLEDESNELHDAIVQFQEMAGLKRTGILDDETKQKMLQPRCGVPDILRNSDHAIKWYKNLITYKIRSYTNDVTPEQLRQAVEESFNMWAAVTPLKFRPVSTNPDVTIDFATGEHGDGSPFDGRGGVLAHALLPFPGNQPYLHFDDDEAWTFKDTDKLAFQNYVDLLYVGVHEIGHVLGLDHTNAPNSIMNPYYRSSTDRYARYVEPQLGHDDIKKIQELYGSNSGLPSAQPNSGSCFDIANNCNSVKHMCNWSSFMVYACQKTCNRCPPYLH